MRTLFRAGVLTAGVSAALCLSPVAHADAPGDNGTVKIHDAKTGEELRRNEPHVCTFYLDAFGFDGVQNVNWHIEAWAPTAHVKGETVKSGDITLDARGHGRTDDLSLPDGHYKLFWNFAGEKGAAKHKVFWTDCSGEQGGGGSTTSGSTSTGGSSSGGSSSGSASSGGSSSGSASSGGTSSGGSSSGSASSGGSSPSASAAAPASSGGAPSSSPSSQGGSGSMAETGSSAPVGLLAGVAAALVGAGGFLVMRRRTRRS